MSTEPYQTHDLPTTSPPNQTDAPYSTFHSYDFTNDQAFLSGLSNLLGHPGTPVTPAEIEQKPDLVLQAKCFYFNRKFRSSTTSIDPTGYKTWLTRQDHDRQQEHEETGNNTTSTTSIPTSIPTSTTTLTTTAASDNTPPIPISSTTIDPPTSTNPSNPPPPPYPTSFASIVDLITQNKPIPGIVEVPDTVLDPGSSKRDTTSKRRKPWEIRSSSPPPPTTTISNTEGVEGGGGGDKSTIRSQDEEKRDTNGLAAAAAAVGGDSELGGGVPGDLSGSGVINILRPDAVPDGGLIAKE